jgi:hypothetical protein
MALALVTGGTAGIGHAFAIELASRGWDLVLVARDTARLEAVAEDLRTRFGRETETITADLAVRADMLRVAERLECTEHPIDMLINNAGFGIHASLLDKDFSIQEKALDVMCLAVLVLSGAAGRSMSARGHGAIINIGSSSGIITTGNYSAVKAWVNTYTEGLANELRGTGGTARLGAHGVPRARRHQRVQAARHGVAQSRGPRTRGARRQRQRQGHLRTEQALEHGTMDRQAPTSLRHPGAVAHALQLEEVLDMRKS